MVSPDDATNLSSDSRSYCGEQPRARFRSVAHPLALVLDSNFDALFSYLTCSNYDFRYDLSKGYAQRHNRLSNHPRLPLQTRACSRAFFGGG